MKKVVKILALLTLSFVIWYCGGYYCIKLTKSKDIDAHWDLAYEDNKKDGEKLDEYMNILKEYRDILSDRDSVDKDKIEDLQKRLAQLESEEWEKMW